MSTLTTTAPRLTSLSHGGGCGCKIAPAVLADLLRDAAIPRSWPALLVGTETSDDAAVYRLNEEQALIATTDFFMPIVDDPFDFGRIAAANALSDVYAMGGTPIMALALVGMPIKLLPAAVIREVLRGGESVCAHAGIPIAGGHSIDSVEPIYGLAAMGLVHPQQLKRNSTAQAGDVLILGKPLGVGVLSAALKRERLSGADYARLIETTTQLNSAGPELAKLTGVHAMTDVTGFGLLGHLLGMCRGSGLGARLSMHRIPLLEGVAELAHEGCITGASERNWSSYAEAVRLDLELPATAQALLTDPQTSGGLLVACEPREAEAVLEILQRHSSSRCAQIGYLEEGPKTVAAGP
jgi:selenide, water dikinase